MPVTKDEKSAINQALIKMLRQQGINISESRDLLNELFSDETTEPINLYVETTGKDSNPGTLGAPLATIQAALDRIPKKIKHPVNIYIGTGTFAGFAIDGFTILEPENAASGSWLNIQGTFPTWTPATGSSSGTATGGTTGTSAVSHGTLVKSGENWTVDDLKGKFVERTGGTGYTAGQVTAYPIVSNTADTITIAGIWTAPNGTSTFAIRDCGTIIDGHLKTSPSLLGSAASAVEYAIIVTNCEMSYKTAGNFYLRNLQVTNSTSAAIQKSNIVFFESCNGALAIRNCKCFSSVTGISPTFEFHFSAYCNATVTRCVFDLRNVSASSSSGAMYGGGSTRGKIISFTAQNNFVIGNVNKNVTVMSANSMGNVLLQGNYAKDCKYGILADQIGGSQILDNIIDCSNIATSLGIRVGARPIYQAGAVGGLFVTKDTIVSNAVTGIEVSGLATEFRAVGVLAGTGNTTAIAIYAGGRVKLSAASTITGSTEISLDGAPYTIADMRAASPKLLTNTYGTIIYE